MGEGIDTLKNLLPEVQNYKNDTARYPTLRNLPSPLHYTVIKHLEHLTWERNLTSTLLNLTGPRDMMRIKVVFSSNTSETLLNHSTNMQNFSKFEEKNKPPDNISESSSRYPYSFLLYCPVTAWTFIRSALLCLLARTWPERRKLVLFTADLSTLITAWNRRPINSCSFKDLSDDPQRHKSSSFIWFRNKAGKLKSLR